MQSLILDFLVGTLLLFTSITLLLTRDWRWRIGGLATQYLGVFALVLSSWPLELAIVKLVAGWMVCALLVFTRLDLVERPPIGALVPTGLVFRLLAAALVVLVVVGVTPGLSAWAAPISPVQAWGGLLLIGMGLLNVGLSSRTLNSVLGLLTIFAGFEIMYAAVEASTLVAGLLAALNLAIALVAAYLLAAPQLEPFE